MTGYLFKEKMKCLTIKVEKINGGGRKNEISGWQVMGSVWLLTTVRKCLVVFNIYFFHNSLLKLRGSATAFPHIYVFENKM